MTPEAQTFYDTPKIIPKLGEILRKPIPRASEDLEIQIIELDALRFELAESTVDAMKVLYEKRKQFLWPRDAEKGMTELDRTTRLNADVAMLERDYAFLTRLEALLADRLNTSMVLLH